MPTQKTEKTYISLMDASKLCDYSQEYLSLRARRGKLKSLKQGRNWVTTKEWLDEYIKKTEKYKEELVKKNRDKEIFFKIKTAPFSLNNKILKKPVSILAAKEKFIEVEEKYSPIINFKESSYKSNDSNPPANLPIENIRFARLNRHESFLSLLKIGFSLGLVFGILIGALIFNKLYFGSMLDSGKTVLGGFFESAAYAGNTFKDYFSWLGDRMGRGNFYGMANGLEAVSKYVFKF
ncbi:MAG: hypothetical protein NT148_01265 [Candidatus Nealsonbacteria bacterium]|nr:hypothetical protein [Candidatus Nealsonbacteria bacterium]